MTFCARRPRGKRALAVVFGGIFGTFSALGGTINVFLVGGQSNADGRANPAGLPAALTAPQADVPMYYAVSNSKSLTIRKAEFTTLRPGLSNTGQFGPELTFGRSMADYYGSRGESVALIKYANGGTNLALDWKAGGSAGMLGDGAIYRNFQTTVADGLAALHEAFPAATITIQGMVWMQGESDCNALSGQYEANLTSFIDDIRLTYGADLPFVIGELSGGQTGTNADAGGTTADRNRVRAAQVNVAAALANARVVNSDAFGLNGDNLHFNADGQQALGLAFAGRMQTLVAVPEPSSAVMLGGGLGILAMISTRRPQS